MQLMHRLRKAVSPMKITGIKNLLQKYYKLQFYLTTVNNTATINNNYCGILKALGI